MRHLTASTISLIIALLVLSETRTQTSTIIWMFISWISFIAVAINYIRFIKQTKNHDDENHER